MASDRYTPRCGWPLGDRLVYLGGYGIDAMFRKEPHSCSKPATVVGLDGVARCPQHDRKARGLSGKWSIPSSDAGAAE
jgi:hypothetical protein